MPTRTVAAEKVLAKVEEVLASFDEPHRSTTRRIHEIAVAEGLTPRLWYGQPGYANGSGPVLFFFRVDDGHLSVGISEKATCGVPDDAADQLVQSAWFVPPLPDGLTDATVERLTAIVRSAAS